MMDIKIKTPLAVTTGLDDDLVITNGDWAMDECTQQHQRLLMITHKGDWLEDTKVGVGLTEFLNGEDPTDMLREIRMQFTRDGMKISRLAATSENIIEVTARYGTNN